MNEYRFLILRNAGFSIISQSGDYVLAARGEHDHDLILHWDGENWLAV